MVRVSLVRLGDAIIRLVDMTYNIIRIYTHTQTHVNMCKHVYLLYVQSGTRRIIALPSSVYVWCACVVCAFGAGVWSVCLVRVCGMCVTLATRQCHHSAGPSHAVTPSSTASSAAVIASVRSRRSDG